MDQLSEQFLLEELKKFKYVLYLNHVRSNPFSASATSVAAQLGSRFKQASRVGKTLKRAKEIKSPLKRVKLQELKEKNLKKRRVEKSTRPDLTIEKSKWRVEGTGEEETRMSGLRR